MKVDRKYLIVFILWMLTGLPILILAIGFAGSEIFTLHGLMLVLTPPKDGIVSFFTWLVAWMLMTMPVWSLIFFLEKRG